MMLVCPNRASEAWKALVEEHGEDKAYQLFVENGYTMPKLADTVMSPLKFKTAEANAKEYLRNKGVIDKYLNIINNKLFNSEVAKLTRMAKEHYGVDLGALFETRNFNTTTGKILFQATVNTTAFKAIDAVKGNIYQLKQQSEAGPDAVLNKLMEEFLSQHGYSIESVDSIPVLAGNAIAKLDTLKKLVSISKSAEDITSLPEEAVTLGLLMLGKENPLVQRMMRDITKFKIYNVVLAEYGNEYEGDEDMLKLEAISKLVTGHLINNHKGNEHSHNIEMGLKWWAFVWERLKQLLKNITLSGIKEGIETPFQNVADMVYEGKVETKEVAFSGSFYQLNPQERNVESVVSSWLKPLREGWIKLSQEGQHYVVLDKFNLSRITTLAKSKFITSRKKRGVKVDMEDSPQQRMGTLSHKIMNAIVKKYFPEYNTHIPDLQVSDVSSQEGKALYVKLSNVLEPLLLKAKAEGSIVVTELPVASINSKIAGTIDLVVFHADGKSVDIYDLKTRSNKYLHPGKKEEYTDQLEMYAKVLTKGDKELGTPPLKVNKKRIIPVRLVSSKGVIKDIVPEMVLPLYSEKTGVESLDMIIANIITLIETGKERLRKERDPIARQRLIDSISSKEKMLQTLQLTKDSNLLIADLLNEANHVLASMEDGDYVASQYKALNAEYQYLQLAYDKIKVKGLEGKEKASLEKRRAILAAKLATIKEGLNEAVEDILTDSAARTGFAGKIEDIKKEFFGVIHDIGKGAALTLGISTDPNAIIQNLSVEIQKALTGAEYKSQELIKTLLDSKRKLNDAYGYGIHIYDKILQRNSKGEKTGKLISQIHTSFWEDREKALLADNQAWFDKYTVFDKEKYQQREKHFAEYLAKIGVAQALNAYKTKIEAENKPFSEAESKQYVNYTISKRMADWVSENKTSRVFWKLNEKYDTYIDPAYQELTNNPALKPLKDFYDLYTSTMEELQEIVPESISTNFIANFKATFIDEVKERGLGAILNTSWDNLKQSFSIQPYEVEKYGKQTANGELIAEVPVLGLDRIDADEKSYDLAESLAMFAYGVYKYKNLTAIENVAQATLNTVAEASKLQKGVFSIKQIAGEGEVTKRLRDSIEAVFYGKKRNPQGAAGKLINRIVDYTTFNNLALNLFAPVAELFGTASNALITGGGGLYYSAKEWAEALVYSTAGTVALTDSQKLANAFIEKLDVKMDRFGHHEFLKLSAKEGGKINPRTLLRRAGSTDWMYGLFEAADYVNQNTVLIACLLSGKLNLKFSEYELKGDKIVNKSTGKEITEDEMVNFRTKVRAIIKNIAGNYDSDDFVSAKKYVLGRMLIQHRSWLPQIFTERFGESRYDYILDKEFEGRYRTLWNSIKEAFINKNIGYLNPWNTKLLTPEQASRMKSNLVELGVLTGVWIILMGLRGDDDDKERRRRYAYPITILKRVQNELMFFHPTSFDQPYAILKSPMASTGSLERLVQSLDVSLRYINGDPKVKSDAVAHKWVGLTGPAGQYWRFFETLQRAEK